ncbi:hypothetical protein BE221DRAFT_167449 [Ostreococcus tauri]|uniref:Uncharacterized protein n=2 Tax=Ostreococcus tauri TaxID=70448 RepID=A0A1Y5IEL6_OSTTA|nr:hypothetical protein BE221DRAFT_167449 [Ostreococcus tauri]
MTRSSVSLTYWSTCSSPDEKISSNYHGTDGYFTFFYLAHVSDVKCMLRGADTWLFLPLRCCQALEEGKLLEHPLPLVPCIIEFRLIIAQRALRAPFSASPSSLITATPASSTLDIERRRLPRAKLKSDLYREFPDTYQNRRFSYCLPIRKVCYVDTLIRYQYVSGQAGLLNLNSHG